MVRRVTPRLIPRRGEIPLVPERRQVPRRSARSCSVPVQNREEIDKSAVHRIARLSKLLLELVELTGIEPVTS
jgi:hypothetical protein